MDHHRYRLFLGIPLSHEWQAYLASLEISTNDSIKHIPSRNYHVTIYFFGEVPKEMLDNLVELIQFSVKETSAFELRFKDLYLAPRPSRARMLWARFYKSSEFKRLSNQIDQLFQQIQPNQNNRKNPEPHITLARFKPGTLINYSALAKAPSAFKVVKLNLYQSELKQSGPVYSILNEFQL